MPFGSTATSAGHGRVLRRITLRPFDAMVDAGVLSVSKTAARTATWRGFAAA
ncbi:hypothetical protein [Catellatospora paridis]|uniref:hypothetical protein n=1 Tax=Catellatospora paridis TaxID=1617086 RepID=UPI0012D3B116|nr:hypothetical protein [Catellatospora paridis]